MERGCKDPNQEDWRQTKRLGSRSEVRVVPCAAPHPRYLAWKCRDHHEQLTYDCYDYVLLEPLSYRCSFRHQPVTSVFFHFLFRHDLCHALKLVYIAFLGLSLSLFPSFLLSIIFVINRSCRITSYPCLFIST